MTSLYIWTALDSVIYNNEKQIKQVAVCKKSAHKYYQIAKPDTFLFIIKF